jgi:hypothetical protein
MYLRIGVVASALLCFAAPPVLAQSVGLKAGVTLATIDVDTSGVGDALADLWENRTGVVVGGFVDVPLGSGLSLQPEALFIQKGATADFGDIAVSFNLSQLQVPVLLKKRFGAVVRPFFVVGPAFSFRAAAENESDDIDFDLDVSDTTERLEYGVIVGGGVGVGPVSVELRYEHGLSDLAKTDISEVKSRTFAILVGFGWGL